MGDGIVGVVKVRPLVWDVTGWQSGDGIKGENDDTWSASAHGFQYCSYCIDWHGGADFRLTDPDDNRTSHPSLTAAKAAAQADYEARIMASMDVQPMDVKISLDTTHVRAMLDDAEKRFSHLTTIAATITVNALRHGATHAQIMDFITGKSDFVNWLRDQVKPKPITINDALTVPEIKALIDVASGMVYFHNAPPHIQRQDALQSKIDAIASALFAIANGID